MLVVAFKKGRYGGYEMVILNQPKKIRASCPIRHIGLNYTYQSIDTPEFRPAENTVFLRGNEDYKDFKICSMSIEQKKKISSDIKKINKLYFEDSAFIFKMPTEINLITSKWEIIF